MSETPRDQAESLVTIDDDDNCNEEVHQSRPAPKPGELTPGASDDISTSVVYSYNWFSKTEVDGESYAVCLTCEEEEKAAKAAGRKLLSKGKKKKMLKVPLGTTKPLFSHLEAHHKEEFKKMQSQKEEREVLRQDRKRKRSGDGDGTKQLKLIGNNNNNLGLNNKLDPKVQERWDNAVVKFVYETGSSFRSCNKFDILLNAVWPNGKAKVNVRSHPTVSRHVGERSRQMKVDVYSILSSSKDETRGIAFTSDMWRSRALDSFMSLTAHFLTKDFTLVKLVPFVTWFGHNRHTGVNMKLLLDQFLAVLGLDGVNIHRTVVTDNASNNGVLFRLSRDTIIEYKCGIHTMSLAVKDVWELKIVNIKVKDVLKKCKELAKFVRRSEINKNDLKEECRLKEVSFRMPVLPNDTRWHSVEMNVRSVLHLTPAIQSLAAKDASLQWKELVPDAAELKLLKSMVEILTRIKICCKIWESDTRPTIQTVIPEVYDILDVLEKKAKNKERYVSVFARELRKLILVRFPDSGTQILVNCVAHLLDPEYKGLILKQYNGTYDEARTEVIRRGAKYENVELPSADDDDSMEEESEDDNLSAAQRLKLREMAQVDRSNSDSRHAGISATEMEIQRFEQMKIGSGTDLLRFWKENEPVLPILSKIAREIFSIPASSASSEREFSIGALVCTAQRSRLLPEKVSDLMLLKSNSEVVSDYVKARGPVEAKYTPDEIKNLIQVNFEQMEDFEELTRRAEEGEEEEEEFEYVEDMVDRVERDEGDYEVTIRDVEDMML